MASSKFLSNFESMSFRTETRIKYKQSNYKQMPFEHPSIGRSMLTHSLKKDLSSATGAISAFRNYSAAAYTSRYAEFESISISAPYDHVLHVQLNRPDARNAMNRSLFREILDAFHEINDDKQCRAVVVSGAGKSFSAGLDFTDMIAIVNHVSAAHTDEDIARKAKFLRNTINLLQKSFNVINKCTKPVIASVHGACIGSGVDLISAVDVRYCSQDSFFSIREVDIGLAADLGTLQRLPKMVGSDSLIREMAFTGKNISANEAKEIGMVSKVLADAETTLQASLELAKIIATKSPVAVQGTKMALNFSRNHSTRDGLEFMSIWNSCMMQSEDLLKASTATATRSDKPPHYADL